MRKKTAPRTRRHRKASPPQLPGLIAEGTTAQQSAVSRCALDNRSHRTPTIQQQPNQMKRAKRGHNRSADCCNRLLAGGLSRGHGLRSREDNLLVPKRSYKLNLTAKRCDVPAQC